MSLDLAALARAVAAQGPVVRVLVAQVRGSTPREAGAAMLVWADGQEGTIGGGALEWQATAKARALLGAAQGLVLSQPLGPGLGQCCGGHVTLALEPWDQARLDRARGPIFARCLQGGPTRALPDAPLPHLQGTWLVEAVTPAATPLWIWGAGHVGRAIAALMPPLGFDVVLVDDAPARFPAPLPRVTPLLAADPVQAVARAPDAAHHLVLTYSHALDLDLCHALLSRKQASVGLIGSATKAARFRSQLAKRGLAEGVLEALICPIGNKRLGKTPHAIAIGVAADLLERRTDLSRPMGKELA